MTTLVDTNILLDIATTAPGLVEGSLTALQDASERGPIAINPVIYAEFSVGYSSMAEVDEFLQTASLQLLEIPTDALFLAGKAFPRYRRQGGSRTGVLPDFFIGAHAQAAGLALLTRDARRMRGYFPDIRLVTP